MKPGSLYESGRLGEARTAQDGTPAAESSRGEPMQSASGTAIARMKEPELLSPAVLEARRLIHAELADTEQTDLFRELRTRLLMRWVTRNPVILVSGAGPGCGTSFVARNLAVSVSMEEDRTALLIDCHVRRPSHEAQFLPGEESPLGLLDFLSMPAIGLERIIYPTGIPRLRMIPAGRSRRSSVEHFNSVRMRGLINELRGRYPDRSLILDAPPARGAPDARILAEHADMVVLVAGEGMHRAGTVTEAAEAFPPAKLAGVIFNHRP